MIRMVRANKQLIWIFAGGALNHPNHFGIIFDSGMDPRSKIPGRSSQGILDPVLANHANHFGIIFDSGPDPRSKIAQESLPGILDLRSGPESKIIMIRASTGSKIH